MSTHERGAPAPDGAGSARAGTRGPRRLRRRSTTNAPDTGRVHSITSVQRALSEDVDARSRRYLFSMVVRTLCVLLAIIVPSPWRWIAIAGAVLIPLVAVLVANAGRELAAPGDVRDPRGTQDLVPAAATRTGTTPGGASAAERAAAAWTAAHAPAPHPAATPPFPAAPTPAATPRPATTIIDIQEGKAS